MWQSEIWTSSGTEEISHNFAKCDSVSFVVGETDLLLLNNFLVEFRE